MNRAVILHNTHVHRRAVVENAILDKDVAVLDGATVGVDKEHDRARGFTVSAGGVTVVSKGQAVAPRPPRVHSGAVLVRPGRAGVGDNAARMNKKTPWIFVDCEARGTSPVHGVLTEFGAVHYDTRDTFHGRLFEATPDPANPAISIVGERLATDADVAASFAAWLHEHTGNGRPVFVSDNPAYDWQWIAGMFDRAGMENPFGHSARRISDFWAGPTGTGATPSAGSGSDARPTTTTRSTTRWATWRRSRRSCDWPRNPELSDPPGGPTRALAVSGLRRSAGSPRRG